ncbi:MAG: hypothetical protein KDD82_27995, partial [Planctomycetes bacterium]|nr:hypothetical protein [Planctomycetota bacterium]
MTPAEELPLIEEVAGAFRPRDPRQLAFLPAWHDLSPEGREAAYALSVRMRRLEAALDPEGQSATVKAVLARIAR